MYAIIPMTQYKHAERHDDDDDDDYYYYFALGT